MSINKNFVVKNGLEVNTDLIVANATANLVGIATTSPKYTLHVNGGIGATDVYVSGIATFTSKLNIGAGGTIFSIENNKIGIGTISAAYPLHVAGVGTALYVDGDIRVTGDLNVDDVVLDQASINDLTATNAVLSKVTVSGASTFGTVQISSGIVTSTSGIVTYYGDGQYLNLSDNPSTGIGIRTTGGIVGYGITLLDLKGAGVSTAFYNSNVGIATIFFEGGGSGTIGIGSTFPPFSNNGDLFYHINYGRTFVYYDEVTLGIGSTAFWVDASPFNVGLLTIDDLSVSKLSVSTNVNVVGVVTAAAFYGDGANLTNTGSSLSAASGTQRLVVTGQTSGIMTASATDADLTFNATTNTLSVPQSVVGSAVTINSSGINATSGIVTASSFVGNLTGTASTASFATTSFGLSGTPNLNVGVVTASSFVGNLTGTATTATNLSNAANITTGTINSSRLTGSYNIDISGNASTATNATTASTANALNTSNTYQVSRIGVGQAAGTGTAVDVSGRYAQTISSVSGSNIDCSQGNYFTATVNGSTTFTVSNVPSSRVYTFTLEVTHTSGTINWFGGVQWPASTTPTLTTGKTHLFIFVTDDGGSRWRGAALVDYTN